MAEDLIYMLLVGAGGLATIAASTYGMAVLIDRVCSSPYSTDRVFSPVSNAAGVWGMGQEERAKVLEKVFATKNTMLTYDSKNNLTNKGDSLPQEGIEMTELKSSSKPPPPPATKNVNMEIGMNGAPDEMNESSPDMEAKDSPRSNTNEPRDNACSICLAEYEKGDSVMTGTRCSHLYHKKCILEWMQKGHDHCPFCRELMATPQEVHAAALEVLGPKRVETLSRAERPIRWEQQDPSTPMISTANADPSTSTAAAAGAASAAISSARLSEVVIEA